MCNFEAKTNDEDVNKFLKFWNETAEKYNWNKNMMKKKIELLVNKLKSFEKTYFSVSVCNENEGSKTAATSECVPIPIEVDVFPSNGNEEKTKIIVKNKNIGMERNHKFKNKRLGSHVKRGNIIACKDSSSKKETNVSENNCLKNTHHKKIRKKTLKDVKIEVHEKMSVNKHLKKPMNAFFLWAKEERKLMRIKTKISNNSGISTLLGKKWASMTEEDKLPYYKEQLKLAKIYKEALLQIKNSEKTVTSHDCAKNVTSSSLLTTSSLQTIGTNSQQHTLHKIFQKHLNSPTSREVIEQSLSTLYKLQQAQNLFLKNNCSLPEIFQKQVEYNSSNKINLIPLDLEHKLFTQSCQRDHQHLLLPNTFQRNSPPSTVQHLLPTSTLTSILQQLNACQKHTHSMPPLLRLD